MLELRLKVVKTELKVVSMPEPFTEGLKNYAKVVFEFGTDWDGLGKLATFKRVIDQHSVTVNVANNECIIPYEVFAYPQVEISVIGRSQEKTITSTVLRFDVKRNLGEGGSPQPETPDIFDQILEASQAAEDMANQVYQDAQAGKFNGADGQDGETPTIGENGNWFVGGADTGKPSRGEDGTDGVNGSDGADGADGKAATVKVGTVTTGAAGTQASVTNSGTETDAVLDFVIPRGADGSGGASGDYLPTTGGTLTGNVAVNTGTAEPNVTLNRTVDNTPCELTARIDSEAKAGLRYKVSGATVNELILEQTKTRLRKPLDMASGGVPTDGTEGQVLTKNANGHAWADLPDILDPQEIRDMIDAPVIEVQGETAKLKAPDETPVVLGIEGGGTNASTAKAAQHALLSDMNTNQNEITDDNAVVMAYNAATSNNGAVYKASMGDVRAWIDKNEEPNNLRTTKNGSIVQFSGAENAWIENGIVKGKTRQNLWVNPSGTANGVTATSNEDGSLTISGTTTGAQLTDGDTFILKPSTKYCLSVNRDVEDGVTISVQDYTGGSFVSRLGDLSKNNKTVLFTTPSNLTTVRMYILFVSSTTASGTYRIMLNEGETAEPWCPPGLNSISELSVGVGGKNLSSGLFTTGTSNGVTFEKISTTEAKITGTATAEYPQRNTTTFNIPKGEYTISANVSGASNNEVYILVYYKGATGGAIAGTKTNPSSQFTISEDNDIYIVVVAQGKGKTFNATIRWQLELGSTATEYEPPQVTTIPIDLQGNELCSLSNGTCDELNFVTGKLIKRTQSITIDGNTEGSYVSSNKFFAIPLSVPRVPYSGQDNSTMCDKLPVIVNAYNGGKAGVWFNYTGDGFRVYVPDLTSEDEYKSWLTSNPLTVLYDGNKETIQLDPVDLPSLPSETSNIWLTSNIEAEGEFTINRVPKSESGITSLNDLGVTATAEELNYMGGVTSNVQEQINGKAPSTHKHTVSDISDFPESMPASDVSAWAKADSKPSYTAEEVGAAPSTHNHAISDVEGLQTALDGKAPSSHTHTVDNVGIKRGTKTFKVAGEFASFNETVSLDFNPTNYMIMCSVLAQNATDPSQAPTVQGGGAYKKTTNSFSVAGYCTVAGNHKIEWVAIPLT